MPPNLDWTDADLTTPTVPNFDVVDPTYHLQQVLETGEFVNHQLQTSIDTKAERRAARTKPKHRRNQTLIVSCE